MPREASKVGKYTLLQPHWGYRQSNRNKEAYNDGWERALGKGHPDMSPAIKDMLQSFIKDRDYKKVILFFVGKCGYDKEYAEFLLREMLRGNL